MPYRVAEGAAGCSGYAVVATNTGRVVGCHPSRERATNHLRALYANVPDAREKAVKTDPLAGWEAVVEDDAYWTAYERQMVRAVTPMFTAIYLAGAAAGLKLAEGKKEKRADSDDEPKPQRLIPTEAELRRAGTRAVREEMKGWSEDISKATKDALVKNLNEAKKQGLGSVWVTQQMAPYFDSARAKRIAVTETTRFFAAGAMEMYARLGLEFWVWQTVEDGRVCDVCTARQSESLDYPYILEEQSSPPGHVICRCFPRPASDAEVARARTQQTPWGKLPPGTVDEQLRWLQKQMEGDYFQTPDRRQLSARALEGERIGRALARAHWEKFDAYAPGKGIRAGTEFMEKKYPWIRFEFDQQVYRNLNEGVWQINANRPNATMIDRALARFDQLAQRFPDPVIKMDALGMRPDEMHIWEPHIFALTSWPRARSIGLNPQHLNDAAMFGRRMRDSMDSGFHPKGSDYDFVLTHEFGHAWHADLTTKAARGYVGADGKRISLHAATITNSKKKTHGYGLTNPTEHVAEGFAEYALSDRGGLEPLDIPSTVGEGLDDWEVVSDEVDAITESGEEIADAIEAMGDPDDWIVDPNLPS